MPLAGATEDSRVVAPREQAVTVAVSQQVWQLHV
jgi:hypothetical protein